MKIGWSTDFIVLDGEARAAEQLLRLKIASQEWIVIVRSGLHRYVFSREEFFERLGRASAPSDPASMRTLAGVLELHETEASTNVSDSSQLAPPDLSWRPHETAPSVWRYVEIDPTGSRVLAVGGSDVVRGRRMRGARLPVDPLAIPAGSELLSGAGTWRGTVPSNPVSPEDDEGTTPVRHPSIEPAGAIMPNARVTLVIDLLREASPRTTGGPLALGEQSADWNTLELGVTLVSAAIDFDNHGRAKVTIRRNKTSIPATVTGWVHDDIAAGGEIEVHAQFWAGTRCSGSAVRRLTVSAAGAESPAASPQPLQGAMRVEPAAEAPDLTVYIALFDRAAPGRMHWRMVTEMFDDLPPKLDGTIDLGQDPAAEAAAMFKQFANLERGKHRARIEGFGERLWEQAPAEFRAVYWALHDHYQRPLAIQFVSDDPHLPWELMRPFRDGETHPPLALRHSVARWIGRWHGYMRNLLAAGRLVTIAPKYKTVSARLSLAEMTAAELASSLGADPIEGTLKAMREVLENPPDAPVALLYFTGHGVFNAEAAAASAIKLQDGTLTVDDVGRREVRLGERHGTVVFFNACEVGATASTMGTVGGWANAFLSRRFRAFIAPLWAIDEEDAAQVTRELLTKIIRERAPIGAALRDLRARHGDVSPTFFSYLLYGDVTARLDA